MKILIKLSIPECDYSIAAQEKQCFFSKVFQDVMISKPLSQAALKGFVSAQL